MAPFLILILVTLFESSSSECECGLEGTANRIYHGKRTKSHQYPWMAFIRFDSEGEGEPYSFCGGSLIDNQHVLTAAHCLFDDDKNQFDPDIISVILGSRRTPETRKHALKVSSYVIDERYDPVEDPLKYDIAILELSKKIKLTQNISTICIPESDDQPYHSLTVVGYGSVDNDETESEYLQHTQVNFVDGEECDRLRSSYIQNILSEEDLTMGEIEKQVPEIYEMQICANNEKTHGDTCHGDSGGPLMYKNPENGRWYAIGVVSGSWGACGDPSQPGFYTSVAWYRDFIETYASQACIKSFGMTDDYGYQEWLDF